MLMLCLGNVSLKSKNRTWSADVLADERVGVLSHD
jgi:hypothetical protein